MYRHPNCYTPLGRIYRVFAGFYWELLLTDCDIFSGKSVGTLHCVSTLWLHETDFFAWQSSLNISCGQSVVICSSSIWVLSHSLSFCTSHWERLITGSFQQRGISHESYICMGSHVCDTKETVFLWTRFLRSYLHFATFATVFLSGASQMPSELFHFQLGFPDYNFWADLYILHGGLICVAFCPSVCLSLHKNSYLRKYTSLNKKIVWKSKVF